MKLHMEDKVAELECHICRSLEWESADFFDEEKKKSEHPKRCLFSKGNRKTLWEALGNDFALNKYLKTFLVEYHLDVDDHDNDVGLAIAAVIAKNMPGLAYSWSPSCRSGLCRSVISSLARAECISSVGLA